MKEIGGYIEFEHYHNHMLYEEGILLNSGRACLEYLIRSRSITHIALPFLLCETVRETCDKCGVNIDYYHINPDFIPVYEQDIPSRFVYIVNYYGLLSSDDIKSLNDKYNHKIIVDNAQAYFAEPIDGIDTLYTCRKFFGVSDGGVLFSSCDRIEGLETDKSHRRFSFLLGRFEENASDYYKDYVDNNEMFKSESVKKMSALTENILRSVDYGFVKRKRTENYEILNDMLSSINELKAENVFGAFSYPLLIGNGASVRQKLIEKKIYVPLLWPNVLEDVGEGTIEYKYSADLLPLPCDQRYGKDEMMQIVEVVRQAI